MKHVHQFYRQETHHKSKFVWKCANCGWFVHAGLEYVIMGKDAECWDCGGIFQVDSLNQDKLKCFDCRGINEIVEHVEQKITESIESKEESEESKEEERMRKIREKLMKDIMR